MHPGSSFIERLLPQMNGATLADTLSNYGYNFLLELLNSLDGTYVAQALNALSAAGRQNLANLIAYLNPYTVANIVNATQSGFTGDLWTRAYAYKTSLGLPAGLTIKIEQAAVYIPPAQPPFP